MATLVSTIESLDSDFGSMDPFSRGDRVQLDEIDPKQADIFSSVGVTPTQRRRAVLEKEASSMYRASQQPRSNGTNNGFHSGSSSGEDYFSSGKSRTASYFRKYEGFPLIQDGSNDDTSSSGRSSGSPSNGHRLGSPSHALPSNGFSPFSYNLWGKTAEASYPQPVLAANKETSSWDDTVWQSVYLKAASAFQLPPRTVAHMPSPSRVHRQPLAECPTVVEQLPPMPQIPPLQLPLVESVLPPMPTMQRSKAKQHDTKNKKDNKEMYSGKVFVGGLPPDIEDHEIKQTFLFSGPLVVDWPHKSETNDLSPPKGYAFLVYSMAASVEILISNCHLEDGSYYFPVSSQSQQNKKVQVRPWMTSDSDCCFDASAKVDPRKTVFVGGVPRPLRAMELAESINTKFGNVCYAGIDTDNENDYPKGAGRVTFSSSSSYIAAINTRFIQINFGNVLKRVELKPYVLDDMMCDNCGGARCCNQPAPYFCGHVSCLTYLCSVCWSEVHSAGDPTKAFHRPLVKEGDRRLQASAWNMF